MTYYANDFAELQMTNAITYMKQMDEGRFNLIVTDPPYRTISGGNAHAIARGDWGGKLRANDGKIFKHNALDPEDYMHLFYRMLKPGSHCYVMTNNLNLRHLLNAAAKAGFGFHNLLIWEKNNANANRWYMKHTELVCMFYKFPAKQINNCGSKQIFRVNNPGKEFHPTQKPVELMQHYIENSTQPGDIILDPFCGGGSTLVAAMRAQRQVVGLEIDPEHYLSAMFRLRDEACK